MANFAGDSVPIYYDAPQLRLTRRRANRYDLNWFRLVSQVLASKSDHI